MAIPQVGQLRRMMLQAARQRAWPRLHYQAASRLLRNPQTGEEIQIVYSTQLVNPNSPDGNLIVTVGPGREAWVQFLESAIRYLDSGDCRHEPAAASIVGRRARLVPASALDT